MVRGPRARSAALILLNVCLGCVLAGSPLPAQIFVTDIGHGDVRVFDPETGEFLGSFGQVGEVVRVPYGIAFHPVTGHLFVSQIAPRAPVEVFDGETGSHIGPFGETGGGNLAVHRELGFHPGTGNLLVVGEFGETGTKLVRPNAIEFNGSVGELVASERTASARELTGGVFRFDGTSGAFLDAKFFTLKDPKGLAWAPLAGEGDGRGGAVDGDL